jgi:hypothetical protein
MEAFSQVCRLDGGSDDNIDFDWILVFESLAKQG